MFWKRLIERRPSTYAKLCCRTHELWIERVMAGRSEVPPRIPVRRVSEGGFSRMMSSTRGRELADRWWSGALARVRLEDQEMAP